MARRNNAPVDWELDLDRWVRSQLYTSISICLTHSGVDVGRVARCLDQVRSELLHEDKDTDIEINCE